MGSTVTLTVGSIRFTDYSVGLWGLLLALLAWLRTIVSCEAAPAVFDRFSQSNGMGSAAELGLPFSGEGCISTMLGTSCQTANLGSA
jgi:hypothetical protein